MKTTIVQGEAMQYKLCMIGIIITGPTSFYYYKEAVFRNSTFPARVSHKEETQHDCISSYKGSPGCSRHCQDCMRKWGKNVANILTKLFAWNNIMRSHLTHPIVSGVKSLVSLCFILTQHLPKGK
jgi:hypothetical protein